MDATAAAFIAWEGTERADAVEAPPPVWNVGDSSRASPYGELAYELLSPGPINVTGVSSWDAGSRGGGDIRAGAKGRAPPGFVEEPMYKKMRNVPGGPMGSVFYGDEAGAGGYGHAGYEERIPGSRNSRSAFETGLSGGNGVIGGSDAAVDYGYGASGGESFGTGFGMQQVVSYGSSTSGHSLLEGGIPIHGSERLTQGSVPGVQQFADRSSYGNGGAGSGTGRGKGSGTMLYKTRLCANFKTGTCTYNENCHFAHGMEELRKPPRGRESILAAVGGSTPRGRGGFPASDQAGAKLKTRVCKYFTGGNCPYGDRCNFLHEDQDTQITPGIESFQSANIEGGRGRGKVSIASKPSYKTRICSRWENGETCKFGENCHFAHGFEELQRYGGGTVLNLRNDNAVPTVYPGQSEMHSGSSLVTQAGATNKQIDDDLLPASALNLYQSSGASTKSYFNSLEGDRNASGYGYWDEEKKWEDGNGRSREPDMYSLEYGQGNQMQPWKPPYADIGTFAKRNDETGSNQYSGLPLQDNQIISFSKGGVILDYPGFKQDSSSSYGQDDFQNKYQEANRNGEVEFRHGSHNELSYSAHLGKYSSSY